MRDRHRGMARCTSWEDCSSQLPRLTDLLGQRHLIGSWRATVLRGWLLSHIADWDARGKSTPPFCKPPCCMGHCTRCPPCYVNTHVTSIRGIRGRTRKSHGVSEIVAYAVTNLGKHIPGVEHEAMRATPAQGLALARE